MRFAVLEKENITQAKALQQLRLEVNVAEYQSRRNSVCIHRVPNTAQDLRDTVQAILNKLLDRDEFTPSCFQQQLPPMQHLVPHSFYVLKEEILQKAWEKESIEFNGASITFFQDLSNQTHFISRQIHHLIKPIRTANVTYRWDHPFHLQVKKDGRLFNLHSFFCA